MEKAKDIPQLTHFLRKNKTAKNVILGIHDTRVKIQEKFFESLHHAAFPEDRESMKGYIEDMAFCKIEMVGIN